MAPSPEHASLDELDAELRRLVEAQERHVDRDCVNLYAGSNMPNPRLARLLGSTVGSRPSLGDPGDKYNRGMQDAERMEVLLGGLVRRLFGARHAELRVPSGSIANLYAFMAVCRPGDRIMSFAEEAAGHPTHHAEGAAGLYGLEVHDVPFDAQRMDVDGEALLDAAKRLRPALIVVAGSMCLFPYSLAPVRRAADAVGARVLYDAAHVGGLIAGGRFQTPLQEGADLMTGSTYKSFGGPPAGFVVTDDDELARRLRAIAYPGLTANFDLARSAALGLAVLDLLEHGEAYADACVANAAALAEALAARGVAVHRAEGRDAFTASHHVAVRGAPHGGGDAACRLLERANVLMSTIGLPGDADAIRIGTQEVTRWGMTAADMEAVAGFVARVVVHGEPPESVRDDVVAFRHGFTELRYVRA